MNTAGEFEGHAAVVVGEMLIASGIEGPRDAVERRQGRGTRGAHGAVLRQSLWMTDTVNQIGAGALRRLAVRTRCVTTNGMDSESRLCMLFAGIVALQRRLQMSVPPPSMRWIQEGPNQEDV
ncbi:MAG: hypothetical protein CSB44_12790 [Gammaproteobacteria bacterium]|nr:MAG: hypothetical protein CSB44_12790 [Gammaproteobacteria bacterium]